MASCPPFLQSAKREGETEMMLMWGLGLEQDGDRYLEKAVSASLRIPSHTRITRIMPFLKQRSSEAR
jgi:hypothetical protein